MQIANERDGRDFPLFFSRVDQWTVDGRHLHVRADSYPQLACAFHIFDLKLSAENPQNEHRESAKRTRAKNSSRRISRKSSCIVKFFDRCIFVLCSSRFSLTTALEGEPPPSTDKRLRLQIEYNKGRVVDEEIKLKTKNRLLPFLFSSALLLMFCFSRKQNI